MKEVFQVVQLDQSTSAQQVALLNEVATANTTEADWLYKHRDNPLSKGYHVFGAVNNDGIIGLNGFMSMDFQIENHVFQAVQSCDSAVKTNYQGKGVFTKIIKESERFYKNLHVDLMFGFPNKNSYPGFIKLGWLHMLDVQTMILPCNIVSVIKAKVKMTFPQIINKLTSLKWKKIYNISKLNENIKILVSDKSPFTESEYERINQSEKLTFRKSPEVVKWKLDDNQLRSFRYYIAEKEDELISFFIVEENVARNKNGLLTFRIADWRFLSDDMSDLACSCAKMLLMMKNSADLIRLWMPTENRYHNLFKRLGFIKINKLFPVNPVVIKVLTENKTRIDILMNKNNWQPKLIETDTLL